MLGFRAYEAQRVARSFRDYDEQTVRELAQYVGDKSQYIAVARERIRSLNDLFEMERHRVPAFRHRMGSATARLDAVSVTNQGTVMVQDLFYA